MSCNLQKVVDAAYSLLKEVPSANANVRNTLKFIEDKKKALGALAAREKLLQYGIKNMVAEVGNLKQLKDSTELQTSGLTDVEVTEQTETLPITIKENNKTSAGALTDKLSSIQSPKAKEIILELTKDCR